jgi:hypothetical protein
MMKKRFASQTSVSVDKSIAEIRSILSRYGADQFIHGEDSSRGQAIIGFRVGGKSIKLYLPLPHKKQFMVSPAGRQRRDMGAVEKAWEQACRQSWRALALIIKAKLEAVAAGITTYEQEFLPNLLLPGGDTIYERMAKGLPDAIAGGKLPILIPEHTFVNVEVMDSGHVGSKKQ